MNHPRAIQIAAAVGKPDNLAMIERQLVAKREHYAELTATARQIEQDTAAKLAPFHAARQSAAEQRLIDVRASTRVLNDEQRVRLAIYLIDGVDGIHSDLRIEAESVLADVLSSVRF